ncbi:MAG: DUF2279 domain-containing protein [Bacteroidota bacterium]|nr:DUF2279 domain-containing protein [Bacteroidota bacterium]MDP4217675.1 DUF2279 domain-containing protein [Bacteroidota bacterium]MDP4247881.1 DUF2279 domain-containing protein [Bacteroidota bacterium]MDP4255080.1 DUF2279 domain-containing protein [Bacteroidota bacterium]MDP4257387.1 DUF2279 domain-containing protein [Bacteroidota bacterium]
MLKRKLLTGVILLCSLTHVVAQDFFEPSLTYNPGRVRGVIITEAVAGTVITVGLSYLWYKKFPHSRFHFFNDNNEWLSMDKAGHATTAYNIAAIQSDLLRWAGVKPGISALAGTLTGLGFLTMIEIMDGHSVKWGFSKGDMLANLAGCALFGGQQLMWGEQRISLKFSYHQTLFAQYYPAELGRNLPQRMLKDYNGQSYWLSFNIGSFLPGRSDFPKWLNLSAGYGAEGMLGGVTNPSTVDGKAVPSFTRYRQFYFSFDTDLYRVDGLSPFASTLLKLNRTLKMPAPALEWNKIQGLNWHWLYY